MLEGHVEEFLKKNNNANEAGDIKSLLEQIREDRYLLLKEVDVANDYELECQKKAEKLSEKALSIANSAEQKHKKCDQDLYMVNGQNSDCNLFLQAQIVTKEVHQKQRIKKYVEWLFVIQSISEKFAKDCNERDNLMYVEQGISLLKSLVHIKTLLTESRAFGIKSACQSRIIFCSSQIFCWIKAELQTNLTALNYPNISPFACQETVRINHIPKICQIIELAKSFFELLELDSIMLHCFLNENNENVKITKEENEKRNKAFLCETHFRACDILSFQLLLDPIIKRFHFHFYGNRETNQINKPEWFFTFILKILRDHSVFLTRSIQVLYDSDMNCHSLNVLSWFGRRLIADCLRPKLLSNMPQYLSERSLFTQVIKETLSFDEEFRELMGENGSHIPCCIDIFTSDSSIFNQWIKIESDLCMERYKDIMSDRNSMELKYRDFDDVSKITNAAANIASLLLAETERYRALEKDEFKLAFVTDIQLRILDQFVDDIEESLEDKFREQSDNDLSLNEREKDVLFCMRLASIHHVSEIVQDWADQPFFVDMHMSSVMRSLKNENGKDQNENNDLGNEDVFTSEFSSPTPSNLSKKTQNAAPLLSFCESESLSGSVFSEVIARLLNLRNTMISSLSQELVNTISLKLSNYAHERWVFTKQQQLYQPLVSDSLCSPLSFLQTSLTNLNLNLPHLIMQHLWPEIAQGISNFIFKNIISTNFFNDGGIRQFQRDMKTLTEIFGIFTLHPENFLPEISDAIKIFSLEHNKMQKLKEFQKKQLQHQTLQDEENATLVEILDGLNLNILAKTPTLVLEVTGHVIDHV